MKVGFIGCGKMGGAIARAVAKNKDITLLISEHNAEKIKDLVAEINGTLLSNEDIAKQSDFLFLGVKPQKMEEVVGAVKEAYESNPNHCPVISMAAGTSIEKVSKLLGEKTPVIRIMPNTPVLIGRGLVQYCSNEKVTDIDIERFLDMMAGTGKVEAIDESLIDAASAVSGCGPAFVYMFIEALADGAVKCGLPRQTALKYAAQMVAGSAEMVLQTGEHPGKLKDDVCSPKGSTIAGVQALEEKAFRAAVMDAVCAAYEKTKNLG